MSNMIKTIKYNKVSGGRIQMMYLRFVTNDNDRNNNDEIGIQNYVLPISV